MLLFSMDINSILFSLDMHVVMKIYLTKLSCVSLYYYYVQPRYSACYSACSVALIILHASTTLTPLRFLSPNLLSPLFPSLLPNSYGKRLFNFLNTHFFKAKKFKRNQILIAAFWERIKFSDKSTKLYKTEFLITSLPIPLPSHSFALTNKYKSSFPY